MQEYSTSNSHRWPALFLCILLFLAVSFKTKAQTLAASTTAKYSAMIELPKAYLSGVCVMKTENDTITGCLFNEFGISALEFVRYPGKKRAKILSVIQMLDKWYIKRVLSRDIACLLDNLQLGKDEYRDERYKINYKFTLISDDNATEK
jgi:hypothetical protein